MAKKATSKKTGEASKKASKAAGDKTPPKKAPVDKSLTTSDKSVERPDTIKYKQKITELTSSLSEALDLIQVLRDEKTALEKSIQSGAKMTPEEMAALRLDITEEIIQQMENEMNEKQGLKPTPSLAFMPDDFIKSENKLYKRHNGRGYMGAYTADGCKAMQNIFAARGIPTLVREIPEDKRAGLEYFILYEGVMTTKTNDVGFVEV